MKTLKTILGGINVEKYKPKHDCRGRKGYEYRPMMESILYAYSLGIYSVRQIEEAMKNDIRFIWLSGDIHRRGMRDVKLEMFLVAIGFNIKKFHQKTVIRKSKTMN